MILILLFLGHYLGDFTHLSTNKMLESKDAARNILWIFAHAAVHAFFSSLVAFAFTLDLSTFFAVFMFVLVGHSVIDMLKSIICTSYPMFKDVKNRAYWYVFGADQFLHACNLIGVYYMIIYGN